MATQAIFGLQFVFSLPAACSIIGKANNMLEMNVFMKWLDKIPMSILLPLAVFLALAPFVPEPHLWEKLKMLAAGTLVRPIDMFDLLMHGTPLLLLLLKLVRQLSLR